ncbi:MAG: hypothetical protein JSS10_06770 [Verrucomicrobia bacterium]|nr:hypothetical protein [Verrucomicrobiota bacterium]
MTHFHRQPPFYFRSSALRDAPSVSSFKEKSPPLLPVLPTPRWLQPSSIMSYCSSFFTRLLSMPSTALSLLRKSYTFIYKRYYLAAYPLNISLEEEKIRAAFKRLQALREYPLMLPIIQAKELFHRSTEDEKAFNYFKKYISQGTSLGETLVLLHGIKPSQTCQEHLASVSFEDIVYYQMLHKMEQAFNEHKIRLRIGQRLGRAMLSAEPGEDPRLIESRQKIVHQHHLLWEQLEAAHIKLSAELYPKLSEIFTANQPVEHYQTILEKTASVKNFAGRILILEKDESFPGKNKLVAVRSVFIQCIEGQYRFYLQKEGFYVYPHPESFFLALRQQMMDLGSSQIQFSLS